MVRKRQFAKDESGAVAPLVGLSLFALIAAAGIAFDYARIASLDTEMQNAADQAALAAASQLDNVTGATTRADAAARALLSNLTLLGNDSGPRRIDIVETVFYKTKQQAVLDNPADNEACPVTDIGSTETADVVAAYVCVRTTARTANFALTPVVGALSGTASAMAVATIESAVCRVPPLMICNPKDNPPANDKITDDVPSLIGAGFRVTGHGNTKACTGQGNSTVVDPDTGETVNCSQNVGAWAPGDFGFLEVGSGQNEDLIRALAFDTLTFDCLTESGQRVETGNPQALYDAINTRFDIYDFNANSNNSGSSNGNILSGCTILGNCPPAANTVKDVVNPNPPTSNPSVGDNKCKFKNSAGAGGQGWRLPAVKYTPKAYDVVNPPLATNSLAATHDSAAGTLATMGYPRDLCHYNTYNTHSTDPSLNTNCGGPYPLKIGTGRWGRGDYFAINHPTTTPPGDITRYQTYRWELGDTIKTPSGATLSGGSLPTAGGQRSAPVCNTATSSIDRRVLTVAVVNNCSALSGASTAAVIGEYVDMFLVEPIIDGGQNNSRGNGDVKDSIYMELIGPAGTGNRGAQTVRRRVPYLVK